MDRLSRIQVTFFVVVALLALVLRLPHLLPTGNPARDFAGMSIVIGIYVLLSLPFDLIALRSGSLSHGYAKIARGTILHALLLLIIAGLLLAVGLANCFSGIVALVLGTMWLQIELQHRFGSWVGGMAIVVRDLGVEARLLKRRNMEIANVLVLENNDHAFTGGFTGRPGHTKLVVPATWLDIIGSKYAALQMMRRAGALKEQRRLMGLLVAILFNLTGFIGTSLLPGAGFATAPELTTTMLAFTLWSAAGHLFWLPTLSRRGVLACDHFLAKKGVPKRELNKLFTQSAGYIEHDTLLQERLFAPVPSPEVRLQQVSGHEPPHAAWNAQQMTLYLSWSCVGFLSRCVGNIGRTELWVYPTGG